MCILDSKQGIIIIIIISIIIIIIYIVIAAAAAAAVIVVVVVASSSSRANKRANLRKPSSSCAYLLLLHQPSISSTMSLQATAFAYLFPGSPMVNSLLATAYISIFPNLLLYFVPPDINTGALNVLVSFAVGKEILYLSPI